MPARSSGASAKNSNKELQKILWVHRTELRLLRTEAGTLKKKLEEAKAEARVAAEALAEESHLRPEKDKELIEAYKKSEGFEQGLTRTGRVSYEYGYRIALGRFRARHPGSEVEEDPFTSYPEDLEVDMPGDIPFDDRLDVPKSAPFPPKFGPNGQGPERPRMTLAKGRWGRLLVEVDLGR
ncbi:hypothetical protein C4D60_Mb08t14590 [Musa balbisiana]|uniref:Uncharacterized protein n=1 Tax=Musa balbisiana TaxID=52838 RepID=A0A4V4H8X9_MUSBA|nr:hypothetical protein C4D60_Mb08t14590 [Musa balbisiana]